MINEKVLLENGFKKYQELVESADCMYQKGIMDKKGIKYYISFYKYDQEYEVIIDSEMDIYSLEITLYRFDSRTTSLEKIEKDVENIWKNLKCKYYEEK